MSLCKHCVQGVRHEGEPEGKWEVINGVNCYVATPTGDYDKTKVLLYLPDVFGPQLINSRLLADDFARNNYKTIIPDYFDGDAVPADGLNPGSTYDFMSWLGKHGQPQTRPYLDKLISALKESGVTTFAAVGYCYGCRFVWDLAFENIINVAVGNHPSLLKNPEDLERYAKESRTPLLINTCTTDPQFPAEFQAKADEILGDGKFAPGYKREFWEGCTHGFSVRGDLSDPKVKAGKEGAFKAAVEWFNARL
ncbi:hypothetical protein AX16_003503 [Volvariella volvacea WC 439]|nr:hypothetical protein AX16_003503 [Volvariella volvacea WC 439]